MRVALVMALLIGSEVAAAPKHAMTCKEAHEAIVARSFVGWRGLPAGCSAAELFGVPLDEQWGAMRLGSEHAEARSRLLAFPGYYRPLGFAREGHPVLFDAMSPELAGGWAALAADLGAPEAAVDWTFGTVPMPGGEHIYASRGITAFTNPETKDIVYVTLFAPTTVEAYGKTLRPAREKRMR